MCDYSLHAVSSRPAELGETLVSTAFHGSSMRGFANQAEMDVAVCLLPGTELAFDKNVRYRGRWFGSYSVPFNVAHLQGQPAELCGSPRRPGLPGWD